MIDLNGHGTHVAGTIGGYQFGVAPYAKLINVKAFDRNQKGNLAFVAKAIEDITAEFAEAKRVADGTTSWVFRGGIINMSCAMKVTSSYLDLVAQHAHLAGMLLISAAGNYADSRSKS